MTVTESAPNQREIPQAPAGVIAMVREIGAAAAPHATRHDREASFVEEGYEAIRTHGYGVIAVPGNSAAAAMASPRSAGPSPYSLVTAPTPRWP